MRLDNRTRVIAITGEEAGRTAMKEYFEGTGGNVESFEGGIRVGYPTREMAEKVSYGVLHRSVIYTEPRGCQKAEACLQVLAMGTKDIPNLAGSISATWYNPSVDSNGGGEVEMVEDGARRGDHDEED